MWVELGKEEGINYGERVEIRHYALGHLNAIMMRDLFRGTDSYIDWSSSQIIYST